MSYSWLLFDADGTLFDYDRAEGRALAATFLAVDLPFGEETTAVYRAINTRLWADFEKGLISQDDLRGARFVALLEALEMPGDPQHLSETYLVELARATDLVDGALEVVQALAPHYQLALITNGIPAVQHGRLGLSPLQPYFHSMTISGEVGYAKPDPRIFEAAFTAMGNPPKEQVLLIGDSLSADIRGGSAYGIATCWFNPRAAIPDPVVSPTYEVRRLADLLPLLNAG